MHASPVRNPTPRPAWAPVCAALGVHLLALSSWLAAQPSVSLTARPAQPGLGAIQARMWTEQAPSGLPTGPRVRTEDPATESPSAARAGAPPRAAAPQSPATSTPLANTAADNAAGPADPLQPGEARPASDLPPGSDEYLPRSQLTRAPVPRRDIWLDYPDDAPNGRFEARLLLFIDEHGTVRHVRPQADAGMPERLLDQARQAFLNAAFEPGELQGQAVKSRIAIAVTFEASAAPRATGVR